MSLKNYINNVNAVISGEVTVDEIDDVLADNDFGSTLCDDCYPADVCNCCNLLDHEYADEDLFDETNKEAI